jgi:protein-S-isoprenylcysteine O-methyltransferase Ste14
MTTFDRVRYALALLLLVSAPGSVLFWYPIHAFAGFWRRVGARWGYAAGVLMYAGAVAVSIKYRRELLSTDFGTNEVTIIVGLLLIAVQVSLRRRWQLHLTMKTLLGAPELAPDRFRAVLLTEGVYAKIRHPRYVQIIIGCAGYACISNHLAAYGTAAFMVVAILVLIPLEERELAGRFGAAWHEYRRRVPALIPRLRSRL